MKITSVKYQNAFHLVGEAGLSLFAIGLFSSTFLVSVGKVLILVGALDKARKDSRLSYKNGFLWIICVLFLYLLWLSIHIQGVLPGTFYHQVEGARDYIGLFMFALLIAYIISEYQRIYTVLPVLIILGFFFGALIHLPEVSWVGYPLNRPGFGMPFNAFGLYCAVVLLGLFVMNRRFLADRKGPLLHRSCFWAWVFAIWFSFHGLVLSLSRGTWIACLLVYPMVLFGYYWRVRKSGAPFSFRTVLSKGLVPLTLIVVVLVGYAPQLAQRVKDERDVIAKTLSSAFQYTPDKSSSSGTRVYLWREGVKRWAERPWTGWGPQSTIYMLEPLWSQYPMDKARNFHNTYIEVLVRMGIVGFVLLAIAVILVFRGWAAGLRSGGAPPDIAFFLLGALLLFAIGTATNDRMDHMGRSFLSLFLGMAYAGRFLSSEKSSHSFNRRIQCRPISLPEGPGSSAPIS